MTERISVMNRKERKSPVAVLCSALGTVLLILLVALCLPLTLPRVMGYDIYTVVSGSMDPAIPTGSLVYIEDAQPEDIEEGDVIAFYGARDSAAVITSPTASPKSFWTGLFLFCISAPLISLICCRKILFKKTSSLQIWLLLSMTAICSSSTIWVQS